MAAMAVVVVVVVVVDRIAGAADVDVDDVQAVAKRSRVQRVAPRWRRRVARRMPMVASTYSVCWT
jgi:hypothetical protein